MRIFTTPMSIICTALLVVAACSDDEAGETATPAVDVVEADTASDIAANDVAAEDVLVDDVFTEDSGAGDTSTSEDTAVADASSSDAVVEDIAPADVPAPEDIAAGDTNPVEDIASPAVPTWDGQVKTIIMTYCAACHGSSGGLSASSYADSQKVAYSAQCSGMTKGECYSVRIKDKSMPNNGTAPAVLAAMEESGELETLDAWIAGGMPEN